MPAITGLQAQKRDKTRVNLYIDDEFFCGLTLDEVVRNRLAVGVDLTEAELANLSQSSDETKHFNKTLEYVLRSPKTEQQVKQYLYKKQLETQTINSIITRLKNLNYINDAEYAERYVQSKSTKYGSRVIKQKLQVKGIKCDQIDAGDQTELARSLAEKYMRSGQKNKQQLYRYLLAKGFDYDIVERVCKSE